MSKNAIVCGNEVSLEKNWDITRKFNDTKLGYVNIYEEGVQLDNLVCCGLHKTTRSLQVWTTHLK